MFKYSLIIPIYYNEMNIPSLLEALKDLDYKLNYECEFVFVIDGSPDQSEAILDKNKNEYLKESKIISLSKNYGSFTAIRAGLEEARGEYVGVIAADLQEPLSLILEFFDKLSNNEFDVVFGQRLSRVDPLLKTLLSNCYWKFYNKFIIPEMPKGGVDIFACNKHVKDSLISINEMNSSLIAQLFWVGFRRGFVPYHRQERKEGESGWSFKKRFKYMLDSIFSYSDLPITVVLALGAVGLTCSIIYILILFLAYILGYISEPGFASQSILITVFGSSILFSQGILGCYIWRILENSKKRPLYFKKQKEES